jgi:hypothetical protein
MAFAVWAVSSMARAMGRDADRRELLRAFAAEHGLREREAEGPLPEKEITLRVVRGWWSRSPAQAHFGGVGGRGGACAKPALVRTIRPASRRERAAGPDARMSERVAGLASGTVVGGEGTCP